jgi:ribosomal peptide maturation radical SAM protein 1
LDIQTPVALDYDGFLESYVGRFPEVADRVELLFETSRGCWWGERAHCTFCGLNGGTMSYRAMAPDAAITMIEGLFDRYADRVHRFASVDNILPREYVDGVFARLKTPPHVVMFYEVKADLSEDDLRILAKAGVRELQPGIEALATSTLKLMRKGTTSFNNLKFLSLCMQYDVTPMWNLLVGFPGESADTYRTYLEDLPHLAHLPPPQGVFPVRFDRFSPYFTEAVRYELKLAPLDYYALAYPFPPRVLMNMAYYFADQNADAPYAVAVGSWIAPLREAVGQWHRRWHTQDGLFAPSLTLIESEYGTTLEDTRRGMMIETDLGEGELACLAALAEPREEDAVQAEFGAAYDLLVRKNLVFRERGRVMSLIPTGDSGVAVSRALAS